MSPVEDAITAHQRVAANVQAETSISHVVNTCTNTAKHVDTDTVRGSDGRTPFNLVQRLIDQVN